MLDLDRFWNESWSVAEIILMLMTRLHRCFNGDPAMEEPFKAYKYNRPEFYRRVREWACVPACATLPGVTIQLPPALVQAVLDPKLGHTAFVPSRRVAISEGKVHRLYNGRAEPFTEVGDVTGGQLSARVGGVDLPNHEAGPSGDRDVTAAATTLITGRGRRGLQAESQISGPD